MRDRSEKRTGRLGGRARRRVRVRLWRIGAPGFLWLLLSVMSWPASVLAQSSSLYTDPEAAGSSELVRDGSSNRLSPPISDASLVAVRLAGPRQFAINDLVTIIVRESVEANATSSLDTEKDVKMQGAITEFPNIRPDQLLQFQLRGDDLTGHEPKVDVQFDNTFKGDGDYSRSDTFTTRITARIIDVKPNGTLVLEARKFIRTDDETLQVVLTGTCRKEDVTAGNTVLSTQMFDLRLEKEHEGELRRATKKGWLTKFFEGLFNF